MEDVKILENEKINFLRSDYGILDFQAGDKKYSNVKVVSLFRASSPDEFISVLDDKNEEIGIIDDLNKLPKEQKNIVVQALKRYYITPEINEIYDVKGEYGIFEWEVNTNKGKKTFYVKGRNENIVVKDKKLIITDVDGCIYEINDYNKLPFKSFLHLEKIL